MTTLQTAASRQRSLTARQSTNNYNITKSTSGWMIVLAVCCLALMCPLVSAYNIDIPSYVQHKRLEQNTMFGFSIALHKGPAGPHTNTLVVGAPKFDTSSYQKDVMEAGAVFNCGMNDGECQLVKFDSSTNNRNTHGDVIDRKSYQWLGATVATSRDNDLIVACAPRYVFHTMTPKKNLRWDPIGTCFTTRNFTDFNEVSPCRTNNWGYHRQGYCQAGLSAAATTEGDRLYIGAPGSWYWQGQAYSVSPDITFPYKPPYYQPFGTGGQTYSYDVTRPENQVFSTSESSSTDDDSYLGYSMVTGNFNEDNIEDIAIGMPRGAGLLGKIVVNKWNMVNIFNITGHQIGEYFGYSLATADVDGNGLDDLIIGAPMYSEHGNTEGKYDVGRVYVLLQSRGVARWTVEHIREGYNSKGRFGLALSTLGDINRDGYEDFAVGAPYDGPFGRGAVYIFHGSPNGPLQKPSQIIKSEDIVEGAPYPRTFGFALSGGLDMDGNTYPDLAVGAYASDQVYIFKSRPVAAVNAFTSFNSPSKLINIEEKRCQTQRDGKWVPCTDIMTCWNYNGEHLPNALEFDVSWVLDSKKPKTPRMFFLADESKNIRNLSITLAYGKQFCHNETVYITDSLQDKLTPLEVETRYNLRSSRRPAPLVRRRRDVLEPVIDQNREIVQRDAINIQKNCGADNICEPDLRLEIKTVDKYLLGSRQPLVIDVLISNMNEDAFEAAFYMVVPKDLNVNKVQAVGDKSDTPLTCTYPSQENNYTLKCNIGNPFPAKKVVNFKVNMLPSQKVGMAPSYDFYMEANSTNLEKAGSNFDNIISKNISIWVETDLTIDGISVPDFELYKASDYKSIENATKEDDLGPQVVHLYNIFNKGPSVIEEAVILIHYPYQTTAGDMLMYMTNQPETAGSIRCDPHTSVNPLRLQLDQNLVRKSYLEERGVVVKTYGSAEASSGTAGGAHIEKSYGYGGGATAVSIGQGRQLSTEEKRRLEKEDEQAATGDASFIHSDRANAAANANAQSGSGSGSGGSWSWSSSWNSTGNGPSVVVSSKNSSVYYDEHGKPHVVETSTEYVTGIDGTARRFQTQQTSGNYQQQGGGAQQTSSNYQQHGGGAHQTSGNYQQQGGGAQQTSGNYQHQGGAAQHASGNYQYHGGAAQQALGSHQQQGGGGSQIENQLIGSQDARPRIQMANAQMDTQQQRTHSASGQPQRTTYSHSSSGTHNPQQHRVGSGAVYNEFTNTGGNFEKVAGGGNGFHANTMDLGTLNRGNIDQELRTHGGSAQPNSYSYHQTYSSGNPQTHANYQQSSSSSSSSNFDNKPYYGTEEYYDDLSDPVQAQHSSSSSHIRVRRDEQDQMQIDLNSPCKATKCETLRCVARNLGKDDGVWVAIRTRMVARTMEKLAGSVPLNISTMAVSHVTKLPYIGTPKDDIIRTHEVFYKAIPEPTPVPDVVPLWVVVLAACVGALILLLLILLLYNCGFFKRNRPIDQTMERQPLRNGYHGDEHL